MIQNFRTAVFAGTILTAIGVMPGVTPQHAKADYLRSAEDMSKCLGVAAGENGTRPRIEDCDPSGANRQQWTYNARSGLISNDAYPDKCLHKATGGWGRNNRIHLWNCSAGAAEMKAWRVNGGTGTINARENEEMCFRMEGGSIVGGTGIGLNGDCRSTSPMIKWRLTSEDQQDCGVFDSVLRPNLERVRGMVNEYLPYEYKVSRRKNLVTHQATSVQTSGCKAEIMVKATMERRVRRNANGSLTLRAQLHSVGFNYICLRDPRVTDVNLTNLGAIGENFYRRRGNRGLPYEMCVAF